MKPIRGTQNIQFGRFRFAAAQARTCAVAMVLSYHDPTAKMIMLSAQAQYDDAMFAFSQGDYDSAIEKLQRLIAADADNFEARLALGMSHYRKGDYVSAIAEGHRAEKLQPKEQLVHTNLSLFYMKSGNKPAAEHHGLQARIAGWRENLGPPGVASEGIPELQMAKTKPPPIPQREMPWKKKPPTPPKAE